MPFGLKRYAFVLPIIFYILKKPSAPI